MAGALNGIGIYDREIQNTYLDWNPTGIVGPNGPITDFYVYDAEGTPVTVFLYDQHGEPIATPTSESASRFLSNGEPVLNIYPVDPSGPQTAVRTPEDVLACEYIEEQPVPTMTCRTFTSPPSD